MKKRQTVRRGARRARQRGAALVLALLMALLLLLAGGALITSTMMSATNMLDATPEVQAYYGAEAGLQAALLTLRGNVAPSPLFAANPATGGVADANKIDFRGAVTQSVSNLDSDPTAAGFPTRLSHWLPYSYTPPGGAFADRVPVSPGAYSPLNGIAYSLNVTDPDNSQLVTYSTSGVFNNGSNTITFGTAPNTVTLTYTSQTTTSVTAIPQAVNQSLGTITVTRAGLGASAPGGTQLTLRVNVDAPFKGYMLMGGTVSGSVTSTTSTLKLTFGNVSTRVRGTLFSLTANPYLLTAVVAPGAAFPTFTIRAAIDAAQPERLLVTSTGYGPRGARKVLMMELSRYLFFIRPPAPLVIRGSDTPGDITTFDLGSSNAKFYTGKDAANIQAQQPTVAISLQDWSSIYTGLGKGSTIADPKLSILDLNAVPTETQWRTTYSSLTPVPSTTPVPPQPSMPPPAQTPDFLQTADAARTFLNEVQADAQLKSRYYTAFDGYADANNNSASVDQPALTFVDGDCALDGGSGLLIVTGTLTLKGNDDFRGLILVMGNGRVLRSGSGNGKVFGAWIVAKFSRAGGNFTAPSFDVSGGGTGRFQFDTKAIDEALRMLDMRVVGVAET